LSALRDQGVVRMERSRVSVLNLAQLRALIEAA
jgi:hypothetical protein